MNKKFVILLALLASMAIGAGSAAAAEIKASGTWQIDAYWLGNVDFNKSTEDKAFEVEQRMRTAFQFIANENLKGVFETQIGTNAWGNGLYQIGAGRSSSTVATTAGANAAGYGNIMLRKGYIDFKWPGTKVNFLVGYQSLSLPAALGGGSAILDDHMSAAAVAVPVNDMLTLTAGYARLADAQAAGTTSSAGHGTTGDAAFLIGDVKAKGFNVQPFFAYANLGYKLATTAGSGASGFTGPNASDQEGVRAYWGGAAFSVTALDPFKISGDINYGKATYNNQSNTNQAEGGRSGWLFDIAVDYTGLSMMTPSLWFAYTSGEDGNSTKGNGKSERMPVVSAQNFAYGSFWLQGGDTINASYNVPNTTLGYWALGLSLKDIKLIDKLSHTVHLIYFKGTNDEDYLKEASGNVRNAAYGKFLTKKDSLFEVDVNTKYQVYDQLALMLELGYINADFDKDIWKNTGTLGNADRSQLSTDAYKAALMLQYSF
jgi:hypothetical protein